jgi:hypothetical protein
MRIGESVSGNVETRVVGEIVCGRVSMSDMK